LIPFSAVASAAVAAPLAAAEDSSALSLANWWEKVTVRMTGDGEAQACQYETNLASGGTKDCKVVGARPVSKPASKSEYSTITFERRFSPGGATLAQSAMQPGDKLLGRQVMALAIDQAGKVSQCKVVAATGETGLDYGCAEAQAERFEASAAAATSTPYHQGFMTILVYGHNEHVV